MFAMYQLLRKVGEARGPLAMFFTLFAFWLLVSGKIDVQHLLAGALSAGLVVWYWRYLIRGLLDRKDILPYRVVLCPQTFTYMAYLIWQIVKANIVVAAIVLNPALPISPVVTRTKTYLKRDLTRVMFAHSVTLTPGTLTLSLHGDRLVVHSLTESSAEFKHLDATETRLAGIERRLS